MKCNSCVYYAFCDSAKQKDTVRNTSGHRTAAQPYHLDTVKPSVCYRYHGVRKQVIIDLLLSEQTGNRNLKENTSTLYHIKFDIILVKVNIYVYNSIGFITIQYKSLYNTFTYTDILFVTYFITLHTIYLQFDRKAAFKTILKDRTCKLSN